MKKYILFIGLLLVFIRLNAQAVKFIDPGQAFLNLYLSTHQDQVIRVDNFKVSGTPYLYGESNTGRVNLNAVNSYNGILRYNTYTQNIEVVSQKDLNSFEIISPSKVDSFLFSIKDNNLTFLSSKKFKTKDKFFLQKIITTDKYTLYKQYYSQLVIPSMNYSVSDARIFQLDFKYYYTSVADSSKLISLSTSKSKILKQFGATNPYLSNILNNVDGSLDDAEVLKRVFMKLN